MQNHITEIINSLNEEKVDFIIGGGVAVILQGAERMTVDLDISIERSDSNLNNFLSVIEKLNLKPRAPVPSEVLKNKNSLRLMVEEKNALVFSFLDYNNPFKQIDVFITDNMQYEKLIAFSEDILINGKKTKILNKEKLIELKKNIDPIREKDIWDIRELTKKSGK